MSKDKLSAPWDREHLNKKASPMGKAHPLRKALEEKRASRKANQPIILPPRNVGSAFFRRLVQRHRSSN